MKQLVFSDHTSSQVTQAQNVRQEAYVAAMTRYKELLQAKDASIEDARSRMRKAWRQRNVFAGIGLWFVTHWRTAFGYPDEPQMQGAGRDERVWAVGNQGEALVAHYLANQLSDDWTLINGYRNSRGEIDQVLVGPHGVITIEVKHINGTVTIVGDTWTLDKFDNYGNKVETGRPPSQQLNQATDKLVEFLGKSFPGIRVGRIVVLSHEKSDIAHVQQPTALPVVLGRWSIPDTVLNTGHQLSDQDQEKIVSLMRRDHNHHESRRTQRNATPPRTASQRRSA
jgi:hypothetical protein